MMTPQSLSPSARVALLARLDDLVEQRAQALSESTAARGTGDAADRVGNVESLIRLGELDSRIVELHVQLQSQVTPTTGLAEDPSDGVKIGSLICIQFGPSEPPEAFLIGLVEQAAPGIDVITPGSPLGKAVMGAHPGDKLKYRGASGTHLSATLVAIDQS
jgi:transcription elongation factor GreA